jgi:hypothetical protein
LSHTELPPGSLMEGTSPAAEPIRKTIVESRPHQFKEELNRSHFAFAHRLAGHPLFEVPRLIKLCERVKTKGAAVFQASAGSPRARPTEFKGEWDPEVLIGALPSEKTRLRLSGVQEHDDEYRSLHQQILEEVDRLSGFALGREIGWSSMTILLSSPAMITPYHIDHQSNLLFQMHGQKNIYIFDPRDRQVLSAATIERYYGGDKHAADYREELQGEAVDYEMSPGTAVHNPSLGPHWVRNGNEVSVSMSINYSLRESEGGARMYQVNRYLRKLGLKPAPPGQSPLRDWIKREALRPLAPARPRSLEELLQSGPGRLFRPMAALGRFWRGVR